MSRFLICALLMLLLTACADGPSLYRHNCSVGGEVCIELQAEEPIKIGEPVIVTIIVTSEKDISDLGISLYTDPNIIIEQEISIEEEGELTWKGQTGVDWLVEIKANDPIILTRKLYLPSGEGLFNIRAEASTPALRTGDSIRIYMTREGGKVYHSGTSIPITEGPLPTMDPSMLATLRAMPTDTPWPTLTPVKTTETPPIEVLGTPAYPPPGTPYP